MKRTALPLVLALVAVTLGAIPVAPEPAAEPAFTPTIELNAFPPWWDPCLEACNAEWRLCLILYGGQWCDVQHDACVRACK